MSCCAEFDGAGGVFVATLMYLNLLKTEKLVDITLNEQIDRTYCGRQLRSDEKIISCGILCV